MLYPVAYGHVMPTAEEQRMIADAKRRIREREGVDPDDYYADAEFSLRGLAIALGILLALSAATVATLAIIS